MSGSSVASLTLYLHDRKRQYGTVAWLRPPERTLFITVHANLQKKHSVYETMGRNWSSVRNGHEMVLKTGWRTHSRALIREDVESVCLSECLSARWTSILRPVAYILLARMPFAANGAGGPGGMPARAVWTWSWRPAMNSHRARQATRASATCK